MFQPHLLYIMMQLNINISQTCLHWYSQDCCYWKEIWKHNWSSRTMVWNKIQGRKNFTRNHSGNYFTLSCRTYCHQSIKFMFSFIKKKTWIFLSPQNSYGFDRTSSVQCDTNWFVNISLKITVLVLKININKCLGIVIKHIFRPYWFCSNFCKLSRLMTQICVQNLK